MSTVCVCAAVYSGAFHHQVMISWKRIAWWSNLVYDGTTRVEPITISVDKISESDNLGECVCCEMEHPSWTAKTQNVAEANRRRKREHVGTCLLF
jgi:hypothetical protein